jgi:hypothetical protein
MHTDDLTFLPPHEATPIHGFHAYARQMGVAPGETIEICVANDGPVAAEVLRYDGLSIAEGRPIATLPPAPATPQSIHRGSYVYVERGLEPMGRFAVEVWFRALALGKACGLVTQRGFCLWLTADGEVAFGIHGAAEERGDLVGPRVEPCNWHHLVGCFEVGRLSLFLDGRPIGEQTIGSLPPGRHSSLRIGALANEKDEASGLFTGDICGPSIYARPLTREEIATRFAAKAMEPAPGCVGHWRFDAVEGAPCRDISPEERHGRPVNYPIRMIPGPRRTDDSDWCTYDPTQDTDFGHAIRFMADAVVDCRWPVAATWRVPDDTPGGQYGIRLTNEAGEARHVPFIVRPLQPSARMICLSTTNTRVAYNFQPFADRALDYGAYQVHPSYPILGHLLGARRPATGEPWETTTVNFELPFYAWLDREGIGYDLYTEWDLERDPTLLDQYDIAAWAGHSEYWSSAQYETLRRFVERGGHILALSGNTAYWRVSVDLENAVIEVRKHAREPTAGTTCDPMVHAAHVHQMDHRPGATMREAGHPEWAFLGVQSNGFTHPPLDGPRAGYEVLAPEHWAFHTPREITTTFPFAPDAAGYETDIRTRFMHETFGPGHLPRYPFAGVADGSSLPADYDSGLTALARARLLPALVLDDDNRCYAGEMWSEMTIWERPGHGIIFCAGSVLASHVLDRDANFGALLRNVLDRMTVDGG